jgi:hypothetical protein
LIFNGSLRVVPKGMPTFRYMRECICVLKNMHTYLHIHTYTHTNIHAHCHRHAHIHMRTHTQSRMHAGVLLSLPSTSVSTMPDNAHFSDSPKGTAPRTI